MTLRLALACLLTLGVVRAPAATIFDGDPVDPSDGRAYAILPGVPLILHQPGRENDYSPPVIDTGTVGDVDLVIRAGAFASGPLMPPPVATPPTAIAGGVRVAPGSEYPFTVIAADGATGAPLGGTSLDGIPVVALAFADLDGDGVVGPTTADPAGAADDARERQELFVVGRQVAVFSGGVAGGSLAVWKGAPASAGGLTVVLGAVAYVGPFVPAFMAGNVPDGPAVATLLPFFPRIVPKRVIDGEGRGGPADPGERLGVEFEPAFAPPVDDPALGTPFALPTDGTSATVDRAVVVGGAVSRARFLRPAPLDGYDPAVEAPLYHGADGTLLEPQPAVTLVDDGSGNGVSVQVVPVDALDDPTDPAGGVATLVTGAGLAIAAPDTDGDPHRETIVLATAAGAAVTIDDAGGANDSGASGTVAVLVGGIPVEALAVSLTPGTGGGPVAPLVRGALVLGQPGAFARSCPKAKTLAAVVEAGSGGPPTVSATLAVNGVVVRTISLTPAALPGGLPLPAGPGYDGTFSLAEPDLGVLEITVNAASSTGNSAPFILSLPVVDATPPTIIAPSLTPDTVPAGVRTHVVVAARLLDDCGLRRVRLEADFGRGYRGIGSLRDVGRKGDAVAGDGLWTATVRVRRPQAGSFPTRVVARNRVKLEATVAAPPLVVE